VPLTRLHFGRKGRLVVKMHHKARSVADTQMHVIARFKLKPSDTQYQGWGEVALANDV
jgi:hypothetical protein